MGHEAGAVGRGRRRVVTRAFAPALVAVLVVTALGMDASVASAKASKCPLAPSKIVKILESGTANGETLTNARQVAAPAGQREAAGGAYFVAAKIVGGPADGMVGAWDRVVIRPGATGLFIALDGAAKTVTPDLGADLDATLYATPSSAAYDRVVACAAR